MHSLCSYLSGTVLRPRRTFERLLSDPHRLRLGLAVVLLMGALYTLTTLANVLAGAQPLMPPVLAIPAAQYYAWELTFELPVYVVGWLLAAGVAHLLARLFGGRGGFSDLLAVLGLAMNVPWLITWLADSVLAVAYLSHLLTQAQWAAAIARPGLWQVVNYGYALIPLLWFVGLFAVAVSAVHKLHAWQIAIMTVPAVMAQQVLMAVVIR